MRIKTTFKSLFLASFALAAVACSDDDEGFTYTSGTMTTPLADTVVVTDNSVMELVTDLNATDKLLVRSNANGDEIYLDWGYAYDGQDEEGNMLADETHAYAKIVFDDKWTCGKWTVYAENGTERRSLGEVTFVVVKTPADAPVVTSDEVAFGVLNVAADGFQTGNVDYFEYYNNDNGTIAYTMASSLSGENPTYAPSEVSFPLDSLETGNYTLRIRRWEYGFRQDLGSFDYFKIALVDTLDITTDETGQYYIDFYLDEVREGDRLTVAYGTGKNNNYKEDLTDEFFNAETNVYRSYIPDNKLKFGNRYEAQLNRNNRNIKLSGSKLLPEQEEVQE